MSQYLQREVLNILNKVFFYIYALCSVIFVACATNHWGTRAEESPFRPSSSADIQCIVKLTNLKLCI